MGTKTMVELFYVSSRHSQESLRGNIDNLSQDRRWPSLDSNCSLPKENKARYHMRELSRSPF